LRTRRRSTDPNPKPNPKPNPNPNPNPNLTPKPYPTPTPTPNPRQAALERLREVEAQSAARAAEERAELLAGRAFFERAAASEREACAKEVLASLATCSLPPYYPTTLLPYYPTTLLPGHTTYPSPYDYALLRSHTTDYRLPTTDYPLCRCWPYARRRTRRARR
jgi:hypothetical protein